MKTKPAPSRTRGRRRYTKDVLRPSGAVKTYFVHSYDYTYQAEGDVTFTSARRGKRTPRKAKKWFRGNMSWGPWKPYWTRHETRSAVVPKGIIGSR